jgi:hypothetical protein
MNMSSFRYSSLLTVPALVFALGSTLASAQNGKLNLRVSPKQAYVFVDDRAISEASKHPSLNLSVGEHKIEIVNADDSASLVDRNGPKTTNGVELAAEKEQIGN